MSAPQNRAAYLDKPGEVLRVGDAPMPKAGPGELIVKNATIAINPLDTHMQDIGIFIKEWPAIFGCDVAGTVHEVGPNENRFKKGDRIIGVAPNLISGRPQDGAFALYTTVPTAKAAILPDSIPFSEGVVVPFALEAAICALCLKVPGVAFPGVSTPALALPHPSLEKSSSLPTKTLVVYGGSSSVGSMVTQLGAAAGLHIISIAGPLNLAFCTSCGAAEAFSHQDPALIEKLVRTIRAAPEREFVGIFDAVSTPDTYARDLNILEELGGGHLASVHPPPNEGVPSNVQAGMIFAINDVVNPVWKDYVTPALGSGSLKCLPTPTVVGKGLESINEALQKCKAGVSATKLVVEL